MTRASVQTLRGVALQAGKPRTYATSRPPLSHGGNNRAVIIGLVGVTLPALYFYQTRSAAMAATPLPDDLPKIARPELDPAVRTSARREAQGDRGPRHLHPEQQDPEAFKPPFGQLHQRKRVDNPPHGRNHGELNERNRQY